MMTIPEIKQLAGQVAAEMKRIGSGPLPKDLRRHFIEVRSALFQRGVFDPVLVRFDSITAPPASPAEIGEELAKIASTLHV
jgi:hypothetical protein